MLTHIFRLLRDHAGYRVWIFGALLSQIGTGFTQVAVYSELGRLNVGTTGLGAAFALSLLPGLFSSQLGKLLSRRLAPSRILIHTELLGAASVILPWLGSAWESPALLLAGQFFSSLWLGVSLPPSVGLISQRFDDEELGAVSAIQTLLFSAQVILGCGLGALLYGRIPTSAYFLADMVSYLLGALAFALGSRLDRRLALPLRADPTESRQKIRWGRLSISQKRAMLLLPMIALAGTPAVALLPSIALGQGERHAFFGLSVFSIPAFLFAKSLGQMLGPLLLNPRQLQEGLSSRNMILLPLAGFCLLYIGVASISAPLWAALLVILAAHVLSNTVYSIGASAVPRHFKGALAADAAAVQYQASLLIMTFQAVLAGELAKRTSISLVLTANTAISLFVIWILVRKNGATS